MIRIRLDRGVLLLVGLGLGLARCGGEADPPEMPGLSGISVRLKADAAQNLHAVYRGYAPSDPVRPERWPRVFYRRYDAALGLWSEPLQINNEIHTPSDTTTRFNQPRLAPLLGTSQVAVAWSLDFRRTRGVLVGLIDGVGPAPRLLASLDALGGTAEWEIKQFALEALPDGQLVLLSTRITPRQNEVWETPLSLSGAAIAPGPSRRVGSPTGQSIATCVQGDRLFVASTYGTGRENLLLASRRGSGAYSSVRLDLDGALGVAGLLPAPGGQRIEVFSMSAYEDDTRRIGLLHVESATLRPLGSRSYDHFSMTPDRTETVSVAQSPGGRAAAAWGRGVARQVRIVLREPGQDWPQPESLEARSVLLPEADNPALAFSGERLHVVYRDLAKNGTTHRSYEPDGTERLESWDQADSFR